MREMRRAMIAHFGGEPNAPQRVLIDRACMLQAYIARLDEQTLLGGSLSDHASRQYLAWSNTLTRTLRSLGLEEKPARALTPTEIMALPSSRRGAA